MSIRKTGRGGEGSAKTSDSGALAGVAVPVLPSSGLSDGRGERRELGMPFGLIGGSGWKLTSVNESAVLKTFIFSSIKISINFLNT